MQDSANGEKTEDAEVKNIDKNNLGCYI